MKTSEHESAAQFLLAARNRGTPGSRIPEEFRPATAADGLAIQARVGELLGWPVGGWKCSVPTGPRPAPLAPIFAPTIQRTSPCAVKGTGPSARIEPEIAFVLGRDLPKRATPYSDHEVNDAVQEARFVLELMGSRYTEPSSVTFAELVADGISNQGLFVGPVLVDPWHRTLEAFPLTVHAGGDVFATKDGKHPDGHPVRPLYWLANHLAAQNNPLRAGMIVTTGSYCGVLDVPLDTPLKFTYGDLGALAVTLTRAP